MSVLPSSLHYYGNPYSSEEPRPLGALLNFKSVCESELKETDRQKEKTIPGLPGKKERKRKGYFYYRIHNGFQLRQEVEQ